MNCKLPVVIAIAAGLALTACSRDPDVPVAPAPADTAAAPADALPDAAEAQVADADLAAELAALGLLNAINNFEIAAAQQALGKGVSGDVAAYAQVMIDEHTLNREQTSAFGPDETSAEAQVQKTKGDQQLEALGGLEGEAYTVAYVDAMVKGHEEALEALDVQIIPAATRPEVKTHLDTTRAHVAQHLERAKALQGG